MFTRKNLIYLSFLSFAGIIVAIPLMGLQNALFGWSLGLLAYMLSGLLKFQPWKTSEPNDKSWRILIAVQVIIVILASWGWYSSVNMFFNGKLHGDRIDSVRVQTFIFRSGREMTADTYYSCHLEQFNQFVSCDEDYHKGDSVQYMLSISRSRDTSFLLMHQHTTAIAGIIGDRGFLLYSTLWYAFLLLVTWFIQLHKKGIQILVFKLQSIQTGASEKKEFLPPWAYSFFFYLGYILYILFVLALFKNIYNIVSFEVLNIGLVSVALITILVTDWGERLFIFSTNSILEVREYRYVIWARRVMKACGLILFGFLLIQSLIYKEKSVVDLLIQFIRHFFDIDVPSEH